MTSGLEGAWTNEPAKWDNGYLDNLFAYEWELTTSPAGAQQWTPKNPEAQGTVPDAHDPSKRHAPMMLTTDLALRMDPIYEPISRRFHEHPDQLADAFARAWYKLLHRDMGPISRYLGPWVPEPQLWQDPVPAVDHDLIGEADIAALKGKMLASGLSISQLVATAWASAARFRGTESGAGRTARGSAWRRRRTGRSTSRPSWPRCCRPSRASSRTSTAPVGRDEGLARRPDRPRWMRSRRAAAKNAGHDVTVPFAPGRTDASQEQTDVESFAVLERAADGFRNYLRAGEKLPPETQLLDRANLLTLTPPEMTVLVGGMRALNANSGQSPHGVLTDRPETLTNDFFVNLLDMGTEWKRVRLVGERLQGPRSRTGNVKWTATAVDLVFGSNSELRALSEVYACDDAKEQFVRDFVAAWDKVMNLDRFDLA